MKKSETERDALKEPFRENSLETSQGLGASSEFVSWLYWDELAREEWWSRARSSVDAIFSEQVMGVVSCILVLVLLTSDFAMTSPPVHELLTIFDIGVWVFFILEYLCRLIVAPDRQTFFLKPWHLVDLVIITIPLVALTVGTGYAVARYLRTLRGVQALQVLLRGGFTAKKHLFPTTPDYPARTSGVFTPRILSLIVPPGQPEKQGYHAGFQPCTDSDLHVSLQEKCWIDISTWNKEDLVRISDLTHLPIFVLETKLRENAYPRAEHHDQVTSFFLKIPVITQDPADQRRHCISWPGLLIILSGTSAISVSQHPIPLIDEIAEQTGIDPGITGQDILFMLIKKAMEVIDEMITGADEQLLFLESEQADRVPRNFLKQIYIIRRELGYITSWLLHTKEGLDLITTEPSILETKEREKLRTLMDKCSILSDNASATQAAFSDLSGYYLDSNGFQINQVMKFLAVLTALTVTPAIAGGLLGMNLIDQPWSATLPQMITVIGLVMLFTTWVYYNLGWFTR